MKIFKSKLGNVASMISLYIVFALLIWSIAYNLGSFEVADEKQHMIQMRMFLAGDYSLNPYITMFPGYHLVTSQFALLFNLGSLQSIRLINTFYGLLLLIGLIYYLHITPPSYPKIQSLQIICNPIIWPFLWVVYTDVLAIVAVIAVAILVEKRNYALAAFCGLFSVFIRQPNVVWVGLFWIVALHQEGISGFIKSIFSRIFNGCRINQPWNEYPIHKTLTFLVPITVFLGFIAINKGVAIGDSEAHQFGKLYPTQIFFLLLVFWIILLPLHVANLKKIKLIIVKKPILIFLLVVALLILFILKFKVTHRYNGDAPPHYFLRNWLLNAVHTSFVMKILTLPLMIWSALSMAVTKLKAKDRYWLYPLGIGSLLPVSLIEQRYYMIFFVLFMLFRKPEPRSIEVAILAWSLLMSSILTIMIFTGDFFL